MLRGSGWKLIRTTLVGAFLLGSIVVWTRHIDRSGWIWYRLTGYEEAPQEELGDRVDDSLEEFTRRHPAFSLDPQRTGVIRLPSGRHDIEETVVVPRGGMLVIEAGAELRFGAGRSLLSYSPILARGTEENPILLRARHPWLKWGAMGVFEAGPSAFSHVHFENARWARVNGIDRLGALSIIDSEVQITESEFSNVFGKDGLYVRDGQAIVRNSVFRNVYRDGIDFDGGKGLVRGNRFIDCGDEGVDLSGTSRVDVVDNEFRDARGGRVAAELDLESILSRNRFGFSTGGDEG
jgi:hypothetical protein